jgi:thiol peroxidase
MNASTQEERRDVVTFKGNPVTLIGPELKVGDAAPDFDLYTTDLQPFKLDDALAGGTRAALIIVVPSIDTSVCSLETVRFNRQTADLAKEKVATFTVSVDLPFAQKRWCTAEKVEHVQLLSDFKEHTFGPAWGVYISELGLLARAIFLVDKSGIIRYVEVVPEIAREPNYDAVLGAATNLAG